MIIASDGLWDYVGPNTAGSLVAAAQSPQHAARKLVEYALRAGSLDNIGVVVIDLRHIFSRDVKAYSSGGPCGRIDMSAEIQKFGQDVLANVDLFSLHDEHAGWLLKESSGGYLGRRWQKRWFVCNLITRDIFSDGSVHRTGPLQAKSYILHYHANSETALTKNPSKVTFIDPALGARLEPQLSKPGRCCISLFEASTGSPFLLAAASDEDARVWVGKLNASFRRQGFHPPEGTMRTLDTTDAQVARTLSFLEIDRSGMAELDIDSPSPTLKMLTNPIVDNHTGLGALPLLTTPPPRRSSSSSGSRDASNL